MQNASLPYYTICLCRSKIIVSEYENIHICGWGGLLIVCESLVIFLYYQRITVSCGPLQLGARRK